LHILAVYTVAITLQIENLHTWLLQATSWHCHRGQ